VALQNMTTSKNWFAPSKIIAIGFYGSSTMCNPDIFSNEPALFVFKLIYAVENLIFVVIIIISYVQILKEYINSSSATEPQHGAAGNQQQRDSRDEQVFFLTMKVMILVGAQLCCWIPVNIAITVSFFSVPIPPIINDILIGIIVPANSLINPIIHTDILKSLFTKATTQIRAFRANRDDKNQEHSTS
jgi:hypothetical protein